MGKDWREDKWKEFLIQGDILFDYMIHNYDFMFDNESIKHFAVSYGICDVMSLADVIDEEHGNDIQTLLVPWIRNEKEEGRIFDKTNWKPFRDLYAMTTMYLGYNKMFQYKQYYFQLALDWCDRSLECYYCQKREGTSTIHFQLALYGWAVEGKDKLQPQNRASIPLDNIMPELYWRIK